MQEIRFHGRGGQGTVVASKVLAIGIAREGRYVQAFPEFGVERRGAPVAAFLRVSDRQIYERHRIYEPDHIVILDATLLESVDVAAGLRPKGWVILNTGASTQEVNVGNGQRIATIDADRIAAEFGLGSALAPIVNTAILGAVVRVLDLCTFESLTAAIEEAVPRKQEQNVAAATQAYEEVEVQESHG